MKVLSLKIEELPSPPSVAVKLLELFNDPNANVNEIGSVIQVDPALTAKIVSYCNSPLMGSSRKVENIDRAIITLGMKAVRMISLSFSLVEISDDKSGFDYETFWRDSLANAVATQAIATHQGKDADLGFLSGLMQNVGVIAIAQGGQENTQPLNRQQIEPTIETDIEQCGFDRYSVGVNVLEGWNFPVELVSIIKEIANLNDEPPNFWITRTNAAIMLASLFASENHSTESIEASKIAICKVLETSEIEFEDFFANALAKWHEYAQLLEFDFNSNFVSLREIELAAKMKMTEASISYAQENVRAEQENEQLRLTVGKDALTGLNNRQAYDEQASQALSRCRRSGRPFAMLVVDIDHFKSCNDQYGHQVGDDALKHVANLLNLGLRDYDNVYRYGGEEFVVTLPECNKEQSLVVAERLRSTVENSKLQLEHEILGLTISIGIVATNYPKEFSIEQLFERADQGLYDAKRNGRNCCTAFDEKKELIVR